MSVAVLVLTPIAILILGGLSILVGGFAAIPVVLVPGAIYFVLISLATPVIALLIGNFILRRTGRSNQPGAWQALLVGAAILAIVGFIPVLNVIAIVFAVLFGLGAWVLFLYRGYVQTRVTSIG